MDIQNKQYIDTGLNGFSFRLCLLINKVSTCLVDQNKPTVADW
jgi:hypothetical protein